MYCMHQRTFHCPYACHILSLKDWLSSNIIVHALTLFLHCSLAEAVVS